MKLYIIVLKTLSSGLKCAQACHALRAFTQAYPELDKEWYETSNNIVVLEHEDMNGTANLLEAHGLAVARFQEPDMDGALTAICVEPRGARRLSNLRLAS